MYKFRYDYVKPEYDEKRCYKKKDSFMANIKADDIYKDIGEDVETRFDTSNYELDRSLPKAKKKQKKLY